MSTEMTGFCILLFLRIQKFHCGIRELVKPVEILVTNMVLKRCPRLWDSHLEIFIIQLAGVQMLKLFLSLYQICQILRIRSLLNCHRLQLAVQEYLFVTRRLISGGCILLRHRLLGHLEGWDPPDVIESFIVVLFGFQ